MLTAGIAMVGGGRGKSLLLPAASSEGYEGQGVFAERFFAKSVDELMAASAGTKTQLSLEQIVGGTDKKDVLGAKDLSEAGTEVSEAGEVSANASLSSAVVTNVAVDFGGQRLQGTQITGVAGQPVKEVSEAGPQADVEKVVAGKTAAEGADELKEIAVAVVEPQQPSLVLSASPAGTGVSQVAAHVAVVSKGTISGEKLLATGERAEMKRETKKKGNELSSDGDAKMEVVRADSSALPPATSIATSSPVIVLPVGVDLPVVPKVETGVASAKSSRVGLVGYKTGANAATGIVARDGKGDVDRGSEMVAGVGTAAATGAHSTIQHSPNAEAGASAKNALQTPGAGESAAMKAQGVDAAGAIVPVAQSIAADGSIGLQGVVQKQTSGQGNEGALPAEAVGAAVIRSLDAAGGDASPVYDGHGMVSATPTSLEVGVANGSHGWLKIRAELTDGGAVNASVSAASSAGQEMLHRELPSLTAYLQSERLGVNTVVVHAAAATTETHDFSGAMSSGDQRGSTQQGGSSQSGDTQKGLATTGSDRLDEPVSSAGIEGADTSALSSVMYGEGGSGGGGWLSVRA